MNVRRRIYPLALAALTGAPLLAWATCEIKTATLPVTMIGPSPMIHARINGNDALFIADSGAFFSSLTPAAAAQYKLHLEMAPWLTVGGVGGDVRAFVTRIRTFTILDVPISNAQFLVLGNDLGGGAAGLIGQNLFRVVGDVEYDLAAGVIRLVRARNCRDVSMAYWAKSQPASAIDIDWATPDSPHTTAEALLNGVRIRVMFDSGAGFSTLTLEAAKRAGVTPQSAGVTPAGTIYGVGRQTVSTWIGPFASFKIGDEEIRNTRLRFGGIEVRSGHRGLDMLLGSDFFLSHRIYVANAQRKLYFTYNGGPVFNLTPSPGPAASAPAAAVAAGATSSASAASSPGAEPPPAPTAPPAAAPGRSDQPTDAAGFARRGAAFAARHEFDLAIADLTRASELAPGEASYVYQRGLAHRGNRQPDLALADLDQALKLKPDDLPALMARAELHARRGDAQAAITDLDAADRLAPKETEVRLEMGHLYVSAGQFAAAIAEATHWIDAHGRADVRMAEARNLRCWSRALWGHEIEQALADCNLALKLRPDTASFFDSRGLVQLRRGDYDRAIADYDRAMSLGAKGAWSCYGRGVARLRKGLTAEGHADIAAATALRPKIAEEAAKRGIAP